MHGLSRLSAWWVALGIDLERGRPGHPQGNGAHERLHRDISLQLESLGAQTTQEALDHLKHKTSLPHLWLHVRRPGALLTV